MDSMNALLKETAAAVKAGMKRVKLKCMPGCDVL
jgi:hypothetical protein